MTWSDERIDGLAIRVDEGFEQVDRRLDKTFGRIDADLRELRSQLIGMQGEMNARFDSLQRSLQLGGGLSISLVALLAAFVLGGH